MNILIFCFGFRVQSCIHSHNNSDKGNTVYETDSEAPMEMNLRLPLLSSLRSKYLRGKCHVYRFLEKVQLLVIAFESGVAAFLLKFACFLKYFIN